MSHVLNQFAESFDWSNISNSTDFGLHLILVCTMTVVSRMRIPFDFSIDK